MESKPPLPESRLLACPGEILNSILEFIPAPDLSALARTNKRLHKIVETALYSHIEWTWSGSKTPPVTLLLRSILRRPELASHIRSVALRGDTFHTHGGVGQNPLAEYPLPEARLSEDEAANAIRCIGTTGVPFAEGWELAVRRGAMDGLIGLLVSQLHNLERLDIEPNFGEVAELLGLIFRYALCVDNGDYDLPKFRHLRHVSFTLLHYNVETLCGRDSESVQPTFFLPCFYLPAIQHLSVPIINPATFSWPGRSLPPLSSLTSLDLSFTREERLGEILSVTKGLKSLRWTWYYCESFPGWCEFFGKPVVDCDQIVAALSHVRDTLRDLTIIAQNSSMEPKPFPPYLTIRGSLRGMQDFHVLERFQAPLVFLVGFSPKKSTVRMREVLPRNLQHLAITDDLCDQEEYQWNDYKELDMLREWLPTWKSSTPLLRGVSLLYPDADVEWRAPIRAELKQLCDSTGMKVEALN